MPRFAHIFVAALAAVVSLSAFAEEGNWETVATGNITVKARTRSGTAIREIWAEGDMDAPVQDIQSTILDPEGYPKFMPYVKECRYLGTKAEPDGSRYVYTRLDLPMITSRDYVVKVDVPQKVDGSGKGNFENHWIAAPDKIPSRSNIVRLRVNEGSWLVTPKDNGKSHVVYKFTVDPGGMVPSFAANMGNKSGISDTFKAVETEAKKRKAARESGSAGK
ncbi:MAG: SRPBCC family protein [Myxococcaceae bacterium]